MVEGVEWEKDKEMAEIKRSHAETMCPHRTQFVMVELEAQIS